LLFYIYSFKNDIKLIDISKHFAFAFEAVEGTSRFSKGFSYIVMYFPLRYCRKMQINDVERR
jgi:hypothetical protein